MNGNSDSLANEEHEHAGESAGETQLANRLLRALIDTMPIGVVVSNADGALLMTNPVGMSILGGAVAGSAYHPKRSYTTHRPDGSLFPSTEMPLVRALDHGETVRDVEILIRRADGTEHTILAGAAPVRDESGKTISAVTVFQDITEREQAEEALQESERRLQQAQELLEAVTKGTGVIIAAQDTDFRYTFFNKAYAEEVKRLIGKDIHVGTSMAEVFADMPEQQRIATEEWSQPLRGESTSKTLEFGDPGRHRRVYSVLHTPIRDAEGNVVGAGEVAYDVTERVRAEEALRESEERFRSLAEGLPQLVWVTDADGNSIYLNRQWIEYTGRETASAEERGQIIHPEDMQRVTESWEEAKRTGSNFQCEYRFRRHDGEYRWFLTRSILKRTATGEIAGWLGTAIDIHDQKQAEETLERRVRERTAELAQANTDLQLEIRERKRAEQAVEAERKRFNDILEILPAYLVLLSPDYHVPFANHFFRERFGESHGRRCFEYLFERTEPCEPCETYKVLQTNAPLRWEWTGPDGRNYDIYDFPFTDTDGSPLIMETGIDITERKRAEEALQKAHDLLEVRVAERTAELAQSNAQLRETRDYLDNLLTYANAPIIVWDPDFRITRFNTAFERLTGRKADDVCGKSLGLLFPEESKEEALAHIRQTVAGERWEVVEIPILRVDGTVRTVLWNSATLYAADGATVVATIAQGQDITERKQAEELLLENEARLKRAQEIAHLGSWELDVVNNVLTWSDEVYRIFGLEPQEFGATYEAFLEAVHPDDRTAVDAAYSGSLREGRDTYEIEHRIVRKSTGEIRNVYEKCEHIRDETGRVTRSVGMVHDITERKQAEQALQRYADRLRVLHEADQAILAAQLSVEEIAEAAIRHVPQLLDCVQASVMLYDHEAGEVSLLAVYTKGETRLGKGWRGPIYAEWTGMLDALSRGETYVVEDVQEEASSSFVIEALRSDGVRAYVHMPLVVLGQLVGSLALGMDTPGPPGAEQQEIALELAIETAIGIQQAHLYEQVRRHAENLEDLVAERTAALQASEARFRTVFEQAAMGIALVDLEGCFMESNLAFQTMLGYSGEELTSKTSAEITYPEDVAAETVLRQDTLAGKRDSYRTEKRYIRKDGQLRWASRVLSLVRDGEGKPAYVISMVEDITEQKQALNALLRTEKLAVAGRLAASLAHEINNPLQSVIGCLGLADEALAEGGDVNRYLKVAREELKRVARAVAQLRDLHRSPVSEERVPVDVNTLLERVLTLSRKKCEENGIEVAWKTAKDLPSPWLASDRIEQVFLNLLLNAIDAMPEGGRLQVSTSRTKRPPGVRITFTDSGVGISVDDLSHIFEPFYSTKSGGLGLGLFISHDIVRQQGGRIDVESGEGKGATFTVWLPVQTRPDKKAADEYEASATGERRKEDDCGRTDTHSGRG
jgi:PAS domain S-box-containing protein